MVNVVSFAISKIDHSLPNHHMENIRHLTITGGNRTMVAAATIVSMAAADGERLSIFPLVCPNKARCVSFSAPDI